MQGHNNSFNGYNSNTISTNSAYEEQPRSTSDTSDENGATYLNDNSGGSTNSGINVPQGTSIEHIISEGSTQLSLEAEANTILIKD